MIDSDLLYGLNTEESGILLWNLSSHYPWPSYPYKFQFGTYTAPNQSLELIRLDLWQHNGHQASGHIGQHFIFHERLKTLSFDYVD